MLTSAIIYCTFIDICVKRKCKTCFITLANPSHSQSIPCASDEEASGIDQRLKMLWKILE